MHNSSDLEYYCEMFDSPEGALIIRMIRNINGVPYASSFYVIEDMLELDKKDFSRVNKIFSHALRALSFELDRYVKSKLRQLEKESK